MTGEELREVFNPTLRTMREVFRYQDQGARPFVVHGEYDKTNGRVIYRWKFGPMELASGLETYGGGHIHVTWLKVNGVDILDRIKQQTTYLDDELLTHLSSKAYNAITRTRDLYKEQADEINRQKQAQKDFEHEQTRRQIESAVIDWVEATA